MSQTPEFAPAYVSVVNEFPEDLYDAMRTFVRTHPNWDQYRLMQVAVAGFLFQQGSRERAVARHYLDGLFDRGTAVASTAESSSAASLPPARRGEAMPGRPESRTAMRPSPVSAPAPVSRRPATTPSVPPHPISPQVYGHAA